MKALEDILSTIFKRKFDRLKVTAQKVYYGADAGYHGARLDVVLDEDTSEIEKASVFDIEPEMKERSIDDLPRRVRFYHAIIDAKSLRKGEKYKSLKRGDDDFSVYKGRKGECSAGIERNACVYGMFNGRYGV